MNQRRNMGAYSACEPHLMRKHAVRGLSIVRRPRERVGDMNTELPLVQFPADIAAALMEIYSLSAEILFDGRISHETADDLRYLIPVVEDWINAS